VPFHILTCLLCEFLSLRPNEFVTGALVDERSYPVTSEDLRLHRVFLVTVRSAGVAIMGVPRDRRPEIVARTPGMSAGRSGKGLTALELVIQYFII
jgi:hypothetical protein